MAPGALTVLAACFNRQGRTLTCCWSPTVPGGGILIQSLLAAPLWAAAHAADPEQDGFAGRWALQGWQLLLNVVTRPILLVIGIILF